MAVLYASITFCLPKTPPKVQRKECPSEFKFQCTPWLDLWETSPVRAPFSRGVGKSSLRGGQVCLPQEISQCRLDPSPVAASVSFLLKQEGPLLYASRALHGPQPKGRAWQGPLCSGLALCLPGPFAPLTSSSSPTGDV